LRWLARLSLLCSSADCSAGGEGGLAPALTRNVLRQINDRLLRGVLQDNYNLMNSSVRRHCYFAGAFVLGAFGLGYLISEDGPFSEFFLYHVAIPNIFSALNILPLILGVMFSKNVHQPSDIATYVGFAIQWFIVGLIVSEFVSALRSRTK
jgi:hypothetical protein